MLVSFNNPKARNKFYNLLRGNCGQIIVKKDTHPAIRREWKNMYLREIELRETNPDCDIVFDKTNRVLLKDDEVVYRWNPRFHDY